MTRVDHDTIVVGVDASECSNAALDWAAAEAGRSGRRLLVVAVWHWSASVVGSPMTLLGHSDPYTAGRHILEHSARRARQAGVPVLTWLVEGAPAGALAEISREAAMLVVGSRGHSSVHRSLLGSVGRGLLSQAHCPVVIIPPPSGAGAGAVPAAQAGAAQPGAAQVGAAPVRAAPPA